MTLPIQSSFKTWCDNTLWPAEIIPIIKQLNKKPATTPPPLPQQLFQALQKAKLVTNRRSIIGPNNNISDDELKYFLGSANSSIAIGELEYDQEWPLPTPFYSG